MTINFQNGSKMTASENVPDAQKIRGTPIESVEVYDVDTTWVVDRETMENANLLAREYSEAMAEALNKLGIPTKYFVALPHTYELGPTFEISYGCSSAEVAEPVIIESKPN